MKTIQKRCEWYCPKCKSDNIEFFESEIDWDWLYYKCECYECWTQFKEWYSLEYDWSEYDVLDSNEDSKCKE